MVLKEHILYNTTDHAAFLSGSLHNQLTCWQQVF